MTKWGSYAEAFKAIWDKLVEVLAGVTLSGKTLKTVKISCNASGVNEIVEAVEGKKIKVYSIIVNFAGTVSAKWQNAENDLTGAMPFEAREGYTISVQPPAKLLETVAGEALNLNLSAAIFAYGWIAYWDDDAE